KTQHASRKVCSRNCFTTERLSHCTPLGKWRIYSREFWERLFYRARSPSRHSGDKSTGRLIDATCNAAGEYNVDWAAIGGTLDELWLTSTLIYYLASMTVLRAGELPLKWSWPQRKMEFATL